MIGQHGSVQCPSSRFARLSQISRLAVVSHVENENGNLCTVFDGRPYLFIGNGSSASSSLSPFIFFEYSLFWISSSMGRHVFPVSTFYIMIV